MIEKGDDVFLFPHSLTCRKNPHLKPRHAYHVRHVEDDKASIVLDHYGGSTWESVPVRHCWRVQDGVPEEEYRVGDAVVYLRDDGVLEKDKEYAVRKVHEHFANTFKTMISLEGVPGTYPPERFGWVRADIYGRYP